MQKIQLSVSKLNEWQQHLIGDRFAPKDEHGNATMEACFEKWLTKTPATEAMAVGTAVHAFIEEGGVMNRPNGYQAAHDQGFDIFLPASQLPDVQNFAQSTAHMREAEVEVKGWLISRGGFHFYITGKIDGSIMSGQILEDHKVSTSKWNPAHDWDKTGLQPSVILTKKYDKTVQHDFYMAFMGALEFYYNQFWFDKKQQKFILTGQAHFARKPDLMHWCIDFLKRMLDKLILSGYADKLAAYQSPWIDKRWPKDEKVGQVFLL